MARSETASQPRSPISVRRSSRAKRDTLAGWSARGLSLICIGFGLFQLYTAGHPAHAGRAASTRSIWPSR